MTVPGIPVGGLKTVGPIVATNTLTSHAGQNGLVIAVALLSTHMAGAPVVDYKGTYIDFINGFDAMWALDSGMDLSKLTAEEMTRKDRRVMSPNTKIADAAKMIEEHRVLTLLVEKGGVVAYSVSRHDLIRAWIGLGLGMGIEP